MRVTSLAERRQDARQTAREHRLSGPGRPAEQQVVPAGCRELDRATSTLLPAHVREVETVAHNRRAVHGDIRLELEIAAQVPGRVGEVADGNRLDPRKSGFVACV